MPRKLHKCEQCDNQTHGRLCVSCDLKRRKDHIPLTEYRRFWQTKKKYGIDSMDFDTLWVVFKGKCCICGNDLKLPKSQRGQPLDVVAIDHDHKTGNIRGLLCNGCNKGIGYFHDDPILLEKARRYLCGS